MEGLEGVSKECELKEEAGQRLALDFFARSPSHFLAAAAADDDKGSSIFGEFINHTLMPGQHNQDQRSRHNAFISDKFIFPAVICFDLLSFGQLPIDCLCSIAVCKYVYTKFSR